MAWLINEIIGFVSKAEEIAYYRERAAKERQRAANADGAEDREFHIQEAIDYSRQALDAEEGGLY